MSMVAGFETVGKKVDQSKKFLSQTWRRESTVVLDEEIFFRNKRVSIRMTEWCWDGIVSVHHGSLDNGGRLRRQEFNFL